MPSQRRSRRAGGGGRAGASSASAALLAVAIVASAAAAAAVRPAGAFVLPPPGGFERPPGLRVGARVVKYLRATTTAELSRSAPAPALRRLEALVQEAVGLMAPDPAEALRRGTWFKLICGASYQDLPRIRTLALAYTLAGADCIDMSASEAVVTAAAEGVDWAMQLAAGLGRPLLRRPWLMVSVNDQEDLHFRKASFDAARCPADCPRPCETICPTRAIPPAATLEGLPDKEGAGRVEGVAAQGRCYGCGRCLAVCPLGLIEARPYQVDAAAVLSSLAGRVDALEIHTNASSFSHRDRPEDDPFHGLCARLRGPPSDALKLVSVSFPFFGEHETAAFLRHRRQLLAGLGAPVAVRLRIWQTDGRPMSGDIGKGTTLSCVRFGEEVLRAQALPFFRRRGGGLGEVGAEEQHFLQLAGGTNAYTAEKLEAEGLLSPLGLAQQGGAAGAASWVHGLAFGGFARKEVDRVMEDHGLGLEDAVEDHPEALADVVAAALNVVRPIKTRRSHER